MWTACGCFRNLRHAVWAGTGWGCRGCFNRFLAEYCNAVEFADDEEHHSGHDEKGDHIVEKYTDVNRWSTRVLGGREIGVVFPAEVDI